MATRAMTEDITLTFNILRHTIIANDLCNKQIYFLETRHEAIKT